MAVTRLNLETLRLGDIHRPLAALSVVYCRSYDQPFGRFRLGPKKTVVFALMG